MICSHIVVAPEIINLEGATTLSDIWYCFLIRLTRFERVIHVDHVGHWDVR